jgi:hypothetical protein
MTLTGKAILEQMTLSDEAQKLSRGNAANRAKAAILVQRAKVIGERGYSSNEARALYATALLDDIAPKISDARYTRAFHRYIRDGSAGNAENELPTILAGSSSLLYTQRNIGGYDVPLQIAEEIYEAMSQADPVLSPDVTDFVQRPAPTSTQRFGCKNRTNCRRD